MTLRVVNVPNPPAGEDWSTVVPGNYLYDVTGVTAILATGGPSAIVCPDASGNGNDGAYTVFIPPLTFVAGLVAGDQALQLDTAGGPNPNAQIDVPATVIGWGHPFTIAFLWKNPYPAVSGMTNLYEAVALIGPNAPMQVQFGDGPAGNIALTDSLGDTWRTVAGAIPHDGNAHLIVITCSGSTVAIYVDGTALAFVSTGANPGNFPHTNAGINGLTGTPTGSGILDEFALINTAITAGQVAGLQAARGSFAAFSAAMLALSPGAYYHLDGTVPSTGRTPALEVTDGTTTVDRIGDGFPAVTTPGPYKFSWQPRVPANTQTPDGTLTLVGMPSLALPAGYVLGVRTPDLQPTDQWSDIAVWWNDDLQRSTIGLTRYDYPPGATLRAPDPRST